MSHPVEQPVNQTIDDEAEFEPLLHFEEDYEIQKEFPFVIRKKVNNRVLKESIDGNGYYTVHLKQKTYKKHVLVAKQFIINDDPEHKTQIDHINRNRADYRLENLRYVSPSENQKNKSSQLTVQYEFVDEISDEAIVVDEYNNNQFNDYYFHNDVFYFYNGIKYRKLHINQKKKGCLYVNLINNQGKQVCVYYAKFKKLHDLL